MAVSILTRLLAFYGTQGHEYWEDSDNDSDSSTDDDLDQPSGPSSLEDSVRRHRETAMRTLASYLGLNFDEIKRLHQARVVRNQAKKQSKASKRQQAASSTSEGQQHRSSKFRKTSEIPDSEQQSESIPARRLPHRPGHRSTAEMSTTRSPSHRSTSQQDCEATKDLAKAEELQVISGASSDEMI